MYDFWKVGTWLGRPFPHAFSKHFSAFVVKSGTRTHWKGLPANRQTLKGLVRPSKIFVCRMSVARALGVSVPSECDECAKWVLERVFALGRFKEPYETVPRVHWVLLQWVLWKSATRALGWVSKNFVKDCYAGFGGETRKQPCERVLCGVRASV